MCLHSKCICGWVVPLATRIINNWGAGNTGAVDLQLQLLPLFHSSVLSALCEALKLNCFGPLTLSEWVTCTSTQLPVLGTEWELEPRHVVATIASLSLTHTGKQTATLWAEPSFSLWAHVTFDLFLLTFLYPKKKVKPTICCCCLITRQLSGRHSSS